MAGQLTIGDRFVTLRAFAAELRWQLRALARAPACARVLARFARWRRSLVIRLERERVVLLFCRGPMAGDPASDGCVRLASLPLPQGDDPALWRSELAAALERVPAAVDRVVVAVAPELVVTRRIRLPPLALADLDEAVALEIDRVTPFPAGAAVIAAAPELPAGPGGEVAVAVAAAPRALLAPLSEALAALQVTVDRLMLGALDGDPDAIAARSPRRRRLLPWLAAAAGVIVAAFVLRWPIEGLRAEIADARGRLAALMGEARAAAQMRDAYLARAETVSWLKDRRAARPAALALLDETARLLPEDAFLLQWSLEDDRVTLIGYGREAARLIAIFDRAELFGQPRFTSALTSDARLGRERFSLELALRPAAGGNAQAKEGGS